MSEQNTAEWEAQIAAFLADDRGREITEDGELLFELRDTEFRLEGSGENLLLHLWSPERNWVRRVLGMRRESPDRLEVAVEKFGRAQPGKLVVAPPRRQRAGEGGRDAGRRKFGAWLRRLLAREFPGAQIEGLSTAPDLKRSFSGLYARARVREGSRWWAVLGMSAGEGIAASEAMLTFGLVWLDWNRQRHPVRAWAGLRLFVPEDRAQATASRLPLFTSGAGRIELYAIDEDDFTCRRVDEGDRGNLETWLPPAQRAEEILAAETSAVERIRSLAPEEIETVVSSRGRELGLRFRGLPFARSAGGVVSFGAGGREQRLTGKNFGKLASLVKRLQEERSPEGTPRNRFYRLQPERWLESLVCQAPQAVDPRLAAERLYRQVPVFSAAKRGVVDLLAATAEGQLVVIELKASADINLLVQGLDYWVRARWHQKRGELAAQGYFPGVNLKPEPPELLLVSPALQFHPAVEACAPYLSPAVRVTLVGLNEEWRRGLRVVSRRVFSGS